MATLKRTQVTKCKDLIISSKTIIRYRDRLKYKGEVKTEPSGTIYHKFFNDDCITDTYYINTDLDKVFIRFKNKIVPLDVYNAALEKYRDKD